MTSLLVGLTSRLARVEGEAATLKRKEDMAAIRSKQVKLQTQLAEAKCLQVYCRCSSKVAFAGVTRTVFVSESSFQRKNKHLKIKIICNNDFFALFM